MNIKIENWDGHNIRFVEKAPGDWWAFAVDVTSALDLGNTTMALRRLDDDLKALITIEGNSEANLYTNIINEFGIYKLVLTSRKEEARRFERWVFKVIKELRQASGLEGFQVFRMLDKEHQKDAMKRLRDGLHDPVRVDFIKANTISNKAVSNLYGHPKMLKKEQMTPDMLVKRQEVLDDTVNLMSANESFDLGLSVSKVVYGKYGT